MDEWGSECHTGERYSYRWQRARARVGCACLSPEYILFELGNPPHRSVCPCTVSTCCTPSANEHPPKADTDV
eukprot:4908493-Prymnesium_polylepis.1